MDYVLDRNKDSLEKLKEMGKKDILVGVPSYKNEHTIQFVVEMVAKGLRKFFPDKKAVIMNSDGHSPDDTREKVKEAYTTAHIDKIVSIYSGISGKGSAFKNIFEVARYLGVEGVVVVDSDLRSIRPNWIKLLLQPVMDDTAQYVTPLYLRHKYDGTITNNIVYPLTRALYGKDIRQPIGGDFAFSSKLLDLFLDDAVWETDVAKYGIDIWMTTTAVVNGFQVGQAALGAKIHDAKDPAIFLAPMFRQVVGTCFTFAGKYADKWKEVTQVEKLPLNGKEFDIEPDPVTAKYDSLIKKFTDTFDKYYENYRIYLTGENFDLLNCIHDGVKGRSFDITDAKWAHFIYDYMIAYNRFENERDIMLDTLTPLYFLKVADFMNKAGKMGSAEAENRIIAQADTFMKEKGYLLNRWEKEIGFKTAAVK